MNERVTGYDQRPSVLLERLENGTGGSVLNDQISKYGGVEGMRRAIAIRDELCKTWRKALALTQVQREVLRVLAANRSPQSVFGGGATLNRNWPRRSRDFPSISRLWTRPGIFSIEAEGPPPAPDRYMPV